MKVFQERVLVRSRQEARSKRLARRRQSVKVNFVIFGSFFAILVLFWASVCLFDTLSDKQKKEADTVTYTWGQYKTLQYGTI